MGKILLHMSRMFLCYLAFAGLTIRCTKEYSESEDGTASSVSYVSLNFLSPMPSGHTRSNPSGGENGDGQEIGQDYENAVNSAVAFFYKGDDGVNSDGSQLIQASVAYDNSDIVESDGHIYKTKPRQVDLENGAYNVLVVTNPGEDWWSGKVITLNDVRNHIQTDAWKKAENEYSDFVMASAEDAHFVLNSNPENAPAAVNVIVERLAARIDYKADNIYICSDPEYLGASVEITGASIVNNLTAGCYLVKRVAETVDAEPIYLGDESPESGVQTNYVIDPWTSDKSSVNNDFSIGGISGYPAYALYGTWFDGGSDDPNWWASFVKEGTSLSVDNERWMRIGYTMENTTKAGEAGSRYSTGVVFKAKFHPKGLTNYTDGDTFFALGTKLYSSMEDMMNAFYGSTFNNGFAGVNECKTWGDVKDFALKTLLDNDPSGYNRYLADLTADKVDEDEIVNTALLDWKYYMLNECGYSKDASGHVAVDLNNKVTRIALKDYGVRTYENATCYYTWWVRHSNDGNDGLNGIMEFAVVRNNIYKLMVTGVYSLGDDVPDEENIVVDVYVNDWLLLESETLPM